MKSLLASALHSSRALVLLSGLFWSGSRALAQDEGGSGGGAGAGGQEQEEAEKGDVEKATDKYFAIVGGDVYTGTGAVLRGATVLSRNGVIKAIGYDLFLPEGTEKLDASGLRVYPGLVALSATTRLTQG